MEDGQHSILIVYTLKALMLTGIAPLKDSLNTGQSLNTDRQSPYADGENLNIDRQSLMVDGQQLKEKSKVFKYAKGPSKWLTNESLVSDLMK